MSNQKEFRKQRGTLIVLTILRVVIGWHLLYEGLTKLLNPEWSASGYLQSATGPLAPLYQALAANDGILMIVNVLNTWGLLLIGLGLFLALGFLAFRSCSWIIKQSKTRERLTWAGDLAAMLQVSLVGYATGGAFLGLAYFDLYYNLIAIMVICSVLHKEQIAETKTAEASKEPEPEPGTDMARELDLAADADR